MFSSITFKGQGGFDQCQIFFLKDSLKWKSSFKKMGISIFGSKLEGGVTRHQNKFPYKHEASPPWFYTNKLKF